MRTLSKLTLLFLCISTGIQGQDSHIDRLIDGELKMTFPSIYFKHNSTDYAPMPYSVDSCFKHMMHHYSDDMNNLVIWRDTTEAEALTIKRIKKLKTTWSHYTRGADIDIYSMEDKQKISRQTINATSDTAKMNYLISLNSVLDISKTHIPNKTALGQSHILSPKIWCWGCWKSGFHMDKTGRTMRRIEKQRRKAKSNT